MQSTSKTNEDKWDSRYHENEIGHGQFVLTREREGNSQRIHERETLPSASSQILGSSMVMKVTADTREEMLQNQREAALRRRKQQFQSGFIGTNSDRSVTSSARSCAPFVRNFPTPEEERRDNNMSASSRTYGENRTFTRRGSLYENNDISSPKSRRSDEYCSDNQTGTSPEIQLFQRRRDVSTNNNSPNCISVGERREYREARQSLTTASLLETDNTGKNYVSQDIDDQTFVSELSEHRPGDSSRLSDVNGRKTGRLVKSPSTLMNMVTQDYQQSGDRPNTPLNKNVNVNDSYESDESMEEDDGRHRDRGGIEPFVNAHGKGKPFTDNINWDDVQAVKDFLMKPVPKSANIVQCYVKRNKGTSRLLPEYRIYLKDGDKFLMSSKKRKKKKSSNYLISLGRNDHHKGSDKIIGKLRSNFMGTEYQIYDHGKNPKNQDPFFDEKNEDPVRSELGAILYGSSFGSSRGPRNMQVCINKVRNEGECTKEWQPAHKDESMIQCFKHKTESAMRHLDFLENRRPKWNEDLCAYVLNFNGRVTMASVKNFQLINQGEGEKNVTMQFGRTGNNEFIMDVQWPMSLFQAFAIALSSCDSKLACD